MADILVS